MSDPRFTPVWGGLMIVAAMIGSTVVYVSHAPTAAQVVVYLVAVVAAVVGFLMTFRDYG